MRIVVRAERQQIQGHRDLFEGLINKRDKIPLLCVIEITEKKDNNQILHIRESNVHMELFFLHNYCRKCP